MVRRAVIVETERLVVRRLTGADLDDYAALNGDPEVMRYMGGRPRSREETESEITSILYGYGERGYGFWAVERKPDLAWLGRAGLLLQELEDGAQIELAYGYRRAHWGQGYATEAALAIRDYAFEKLGVPRLISIVHAENLASQRVAEKAGLRFQRKTVFRGFDVRIFALEREALRKVKTAVDSGRPAC
jgi:ribosomal-protein-alanine N-acetyltransferase